MNAIIFFHTLHITLCSHCVELSISRISFIHPNRCVCISGGMDLEFKVYWEFYQDVKAVAMDLN